MKRGRRGVGVARPVNRGATATILGAAVACCAGPAAAQIVQPEPGHTRVAVAVVAPPPVGVAGLVRRIEAERAAMRRLHARVRPLCSAEGVGFVLDAPPQHWLRALRTILGVAEPLGAEQPMDSVLAAGGPPRSAAAPHHPASPPLLDGGPGAQFDSLFAVARGAARIRASCGVESGLSAFIERASYAVHGPVAAEAGAAVAAVLERAGRRGPEPARLAGEPLSERALFERASPRRLVVRRPTVTTWMGLSYPSRGGVEPAALRLLALHLEDRLRRSTTAAELYELSVSVEESIGGDRLVARLTAAPDAAEQLERLTRETLAAVAVWALPDDRFTELLQRYRGRRALQLATPESRALASARAISLGRSAGAVAREVRHLVPGDLMAAAGALEAPDAAVLGPPPRSAP